MSWYPGVHAPSGAQCIVSCVSCVCVFRFSFVYARFPHGLATANTTATHPHQHTFRVSPAAVLAGQILSLEMAGYLMITQGRQRLPRRLLTRGSSRAAVALVLLRSRSPSRAPPPRILHHHWLAVAVCRPVGPPSLFSSVMAASQPVTPQSIVYSSAGRPETF